jgi:hypothetical protein
MLKNRNLSIAKLIGGEKINEYEIATVIATGNKTVDIKMLTGGIYRRVPVSGSANVGDQVNVLFLKGKPSVIAGGSGSSGATQIIINSGVAEAPIGDYAPSPHDVFGSHHSWPSNATGQFLATTSTPGAPAFRYIALSDIQSIADTRYALRSIVITAGDGLLGTGPLAADITLAVNPGNGIQISSDAVAIKLNATASGLSLDANGLAIADSIAGNGIGISSKILSVASATTINDSVPALQGLQAEADGLRIYASSAPGASQHILASNSSGRLTLPLFLATTSVSTPSLISASGLSLTITSATDTILNPGSDLVKLASSKSFQSEGYASQTTGMRITHSGEGDFRYIYTDELHAKSFIADLEQALAGGQIISKSVAVLATSYTLPAAGSSSQFTINDLPSAQGMRAFEAGDFIGFRQFDRSGGGLLIGWAWGTVSSYVDNNNGTQSWTFSRSASLDAGIASGTINKDSIVLDFGKSGNGYHEVNAIDGLQGTNSPYSQIVTWATHPRTRTVRTRLGNLRGIFGASGSSVYSLVIQNATGGTFLIQIDEERTGAIAYNASAATVATAINSIIAGATVSLVISGTTTYTYTITIPSTYSDLPFSVNGKNITGTAALDFVCTLTSQTDSEFGLYAGQGTNVNDTYIRISDTTVEFRNTPVKLYDGSNETMRLWAGSGNNAPSFAMGSALPLGPLTNSTGVWMGLSGGSYQFRIGAANGTALTSGMHWTGSQLNIIGAIRLSGTTYATPTVSGLYADSGRIGYYNAAASAYQTYMDSSGNFYLGGTSGSLTWDGATLAIDGNITAQNGRIEGTLAVGTSGQILQGAGSIGSNFTGLRIWSDPWATTYTYTVTATGGSFTMSYFGATTIATAYNATAATLQSNLRNLSTIGSTGVNVTKVGSVFTISLQPSIVKPANALTANGALLTGGTGTLATTANTQIGKIAGYNRNVQQWFATTDGKIKTGAGKISMTSDGILMESSSNPSGVPSYSGTAGVKFSSNVDDSASVYGVLYGENDGAGNKKTILYNESSNTSWVALEDGGVISRHSLGVGTTWALQTLSDGSNGMSIEWFSSTLGSLAKYIFSTAGATFPKQVTVNAVLEAQNTQIMRYKYGPSGFSDSNTNPYLEYTVTSNTGGYPYGSFFINFAGRDGGNNTTQELWYFQVYRNYQGVYVWSSQRVAGTANVFAREITNTAGSSPNFTGTLTLRWWVGSIALTYNDGLEITVSELSSGISAGHRGTFSVGSTETVTGTSPTPAQQGNMFAGTIIATDKVTATNGAIVPASNNSAVFALDASAGTTTTLAADGTYQPFSNANNFSGMVLVSNTTDRSVGLFLFGGGGVTLVSQSSAGKYSANLNNSGTINVYISGTVVTVQNKNATSRNVRVIGVRMETAI